MRATSTVVPAVHWLTGKMLGTLHDDVIDTSAPTISFPFSVSVSHHGPVDQLNSLGNICRGKKSLRSKKGVIRPSLTEGNLQNWLELRSDRLLVLACAVNFYGKPFRMRTLYGRNGPREAQPVFWPKLAGRPVPLTHAPLTDTASSVTRGGNQAD